MKKFKKENLSYKDAVEWAMNIWEWLVNTGKDKWQYSREVDSSINTLRGLCPLCEYTKQQQFPPNRRDITCDVCCLTNFCGTPYNSWDVAKEGEEKKELAKPGYCILKEEYKLLKKGH